MIEELKKENKTPVYVRIILYVFWFLLHFYVIVYTCEFCGPMVLYKNIMYRPSLYLGKLESITLVYLPVIILGYVALYGIFNWIKDRITKITLILLIGTYSFLIIFKGLFTQWFSGCSCAF